MKPIRKAVFPVAGLGTRFLPATKAMPKEMLPVVDRPLIQHVVDEAREAGIEHFIFVTGRNKGVIEDHFDRQFELEATLHGRDQRPPISSCWRSDLPGPGTTSFTRQQSPLGLGHAVWCARELVGHEPFALLLPDVLVQHERGCLAQMIDAARDARRSANIIAVEEVPPRARAHVRRGRRRRDAQAASCSRSPQMVEKPAREKAPSNLIITGRYILQPEIFDILADADARRRRRDPAHRRDDRARQDAAVLRAASSRAAASTAARRSASSPPTSPMRSRARTSRRQLRAELKRLLRD